MTTTTVLDPAVSGALIQAAGSVVAALLAFLAVLITSRVLLDRKQLRRRLAQAYHDILVYQEIEKVHNEIEIGRTGKSNQRKIRDIVYKEKGLRVTGRNTPSAVQRKLYALDNVVD